MYLRPVSDGNTIVRLVAQCVAGNQPMLLRGPHGIGKSELFQTAAATLGLDFISLDLSLMEPPDLVGIPYIEEGRTRFAAPAILPTSGSGILTIEELNRAPRYMIAPCLQLLTERRLNDYVLAPGWIPMAAINPADEGYHVEDLDAALLSRFVQVELQADVEHWAEWARERGRIHEKVISFAEQSPGIFAKGETNPRSLTYLSGQLRAWEHCHHDRELLLTAATGLIGETWAIAFLQFLEGGDSPLLPVEVLHDYGSAKPRLCAWTSAGQLDLVRATLQSLLRHLDQKGRLNDLPDDDHQVGNLRGFVSDLPPDLRLETQEWFAARRSELLAA